MKFINFLNKKIRLPKEKNKGQAMLISVVYFLFISLSVVSGIVSPSVREYKTSSVDLNSKKSYFLAESGVEDAVYRIKTGKTIGSSEALSLQGNTVTTSISDIGNGKTIESVGDVSNYDRTLSVSLTTGSGVSFSYGVQVGQGGIDMTGSSGINGNVYANGPITGSSSSFITGTAISGNAPSLLSDQSNGTGTPANNIIFGNATATQDIAQAFKVPSNLPLSKVSFYIRKVGNPGSETVRLVLDNGGNPSTTNIATGTLIASNVTTSYAWVDAVFSTNPVVDPDNKYWLIIDGASSASNYYIIGANNDGYASGISKIGRYSVSWNDNSPANADLYFNIYSGGMTGRIAGSSGSQWNQLRVGTSSGTAQANTVNYTHASGNIYCQNGTGNNKSCTNQTDPTYQALPVSEGNITQWKDDASLGGTISGDYNLGGSSTATLGPKRITGNLTVGGSGTLYVSGTLWVEGNIILSGSGKIRLANSYGSNSGIIVSDGLIDNGGSGQFLGTGSSGSFIMVLTTSYCDTTFCAADAINVSGSAGSVILYAANGTINFSGSARAKEAIAYKMKLSGSATVDYDSGLVNPNFVSGPSGSWDIGTWAESE